jgi:hypothetical protein
MKTENRKLEIEIFFSLSKPVTTTKFYFILFYKNKYIYIFIYFTSAWTQPRVCADSRGEKGRGGSEGEGGASPRTH